MSDVFYARPVTQGRRGSLCLVGCGTRVEPWVVVTDGEITGIKTLEVEGIDVEHTIERCRELRGNS